ncbi:MAG: hypothetical protein ACRDSR_23375 [Pseudonocardiaceae bacterium]
MGDQFDIVPESLTSASKSLTQSADDHAAAVQKLQSRILGAGSPWGSDEIGSMFGEAYNEVSKLGIEALTALTEGVRGTADGLQAMAHNTQQSDRDAAAGFENMGVTL